MKLWIENFLFACRWLLVPLYILLALGLLELLLQAAVNVYGVVEHFWTLGEEGVLLSVLSVVDLTLTASLVVTVFISGYTNFVAPVASYEDDGRPNWIAQIDFSALKIRVMASIVAISAIKLLEGFLDIANHTDRELAWLVGIHLAFVVTTLLLSLSDRTVRRVGG